MEKLNFVLLGFQLNQIPVWGLILILVIATLIIAFFPWKKIKNIIKVKKELKEKIIKEKIEKKKREEDDF